MSILKAISLLALATMLSAPTLAQAQTRGDQPQRFDGGETSYGDNEPNPARRLPRSTDDTFCQIQDKGAEGFNVVVINTTGEDIPAGTVVTIYLQPGDIQKSFKVEQPWLDGFLMFLPNWRPMDTPTDCAVKIAPRRDVKDEPIFTRPDEGVRKMKLGFHETLGMICVIYWWHGTNNKGIGFTNTSGEVIPKGTVFTFIIQPSGQTGTWTLSGDMEPGETLVLDKLSGVDADQIECDLVVKDKVHDEKPAADKLP